MDSRKLNVGVALNCPTIDQLEAGINAYTGNKWCIVNFVRGGNYITFSICEEKSVTVEKLNRDTKTLEQETHAKAAVTPVKVIYHGDGSVWVITLRGGPGSLKVVKRFIDDISDAEETVQIEVPEIDPIDMFRKFEARHASVTTDEAGNQISHCNLTTAKFKAYHAKDDVYGVFTPKFSTTAEGVEFVEAFIDELKDITVKWGAEADAVRIKFGKNASYSVGLGETVLWDLVEEEILEYTPKTVNTNVEVKDEE